MIFVRQRFRHDCGVAVAAMIGDVPYEAVLDRLVVGLSPNNPLCSLTMHRTLQDITGADWQMDEQWQHWPRLSDWPFPQTPTVALIQRTEPSRPSRHYIVIQGVVVYDPLFATPLAKAGYPDRDAWVVTTFARNTVGCDANS